MIIIGNVQDSGKYTCELDSDEDDPLSVTHTLQILGEILIVIMIMIMNIANDNDYDKDDPLSVTRTLQILGEIRIKCQ